MSFDLEAMRSGVDIYQAMRTPGWMTENELVWLAQQARRSDCIVEVGSWKGRSTCALAANCAGWVYAVDTWMGSPEHEEELAGHEVGWLYNQFCGNTHSFANVLPVCGASVQVATHFVAHGVQPDLVFIDAAHDYQYVVDDIKAWRPLVKPGGVLAGHDYDARLHPAVVRAVASTLGTVKVYETIWWVEV